MAKVRVKDFGFVCCINHFIYHICVFIEPHSHPKPVSIYPIRQNDSANFCIFMPSLFQAITEVTKLRIF